MASNSSPAARRERERLRELYRPAEVRLLFIGEAPPASGRFFYQADSGLYRAFRDGFRAIDPAVNDDNFLAGFQSSGCYLIDLCRDPVDQLDPLSRREAWRDSEPHLSRRIVELQPLRIATVVRSIRGSAGRAVCAAGWNGTMFDLPYPGRWSRHRKVFVEGLVRLCENCRCADRILPCDPGVSRRFSTLCGRD